MKPMNVVSTAARCVASAVVISLVGIALYQFDSSVLVDLQRGNINEYIFSAWRSLLLLFLSVCIVWLSSRALSPKPGDLASMAVGLIVCSAFILYFEIAPYLYDFGLLYALLFFIYICALVVGFAGRVIA